jgi:hypothetical protein
VIGYFERFSVLSAWALVTALTLVVQIARALGVHDICDNTAKYYGRLRLCALKGW